MLPPYLRLEPFNEGPFLVPRTRWKARLPAGVVKKLEAVPPPFGRNLGQEKALAASPGDDKAVAAHYDLVHLGGFGDGQGRNFDAEAGELTGGNGVESGVLHSGRHCHAANRFIQRACGDDGADASAEISSERVEGDEGPSWFRGEDAVIGAPDEQALLRKERVDGAAG